MGNANLRNELNEKNRKLELIIKQTNLLNERIKPYPWGVKNSLVKSKSITTTTTVSKQNEGILRDLDNKCNTLRQQNEAKERKIGDLVRENDSLKDRILNLLRI